MKHHHTLALTLAALLFLPTLAFAACSTPAGTEGQVRYDSTEKKMFFCDDTNWKGMGGGSHKFRAHVGVAYAWNGADTHTVTMDTEDYDSDNNYNPATYIYTVPEDGTYTFSADVYGSSLDGSIHGVIISTSTATEICHTYGTYSNNVLFTSCTGSMELTAGDTVWVTAHTNNAPSANIWGQWSGYKID